MFDSYLPHPQAAQILGHLPQEQLQLAARHMDLLLGLPALLRPVLGLELRPQRSEGDQLSLSPEQILLQLLRTTNIQ